MDNDYKYKGINLTAAVAKELIIEHYRGKTFNRNTMIEDICNIHTKLGGILNNDNVGNFSAKSALSQLKDEGVAKNPVEGYWRIIDPDDPVGYEYRDIPLTRAVTVSLLLDLYTGETFSRKDAIDLISTTHIERGGLPGTQDHYTKQIKSGLRQLKDQGKADNPTRNYWRIYEEDDVNIDDEIIDDLEDDEIEDDEIDISPEKEVEKTIGYGSMCVYVYYYHSDKELAELKEEEYYPCKMGYTTNSATDRIDEQLGTANPEYPVIALEIKTDDPKKLETVMQYSLELRGRHKKDAPGKEWYMTNPVEIESIYEYVCGQSNNMIIKE